MPVRVIPLLSRARVARWRGWAHFARRLRRLLPGPLGRSRQRLAHLGRRQPRRVVAPVQPLERAIEPLHRALEPIGARLRVRPPLLSEPLLLCTLFLGARGLPAPLLARERERLHLPALRFLLELRGAMGIARRIGGGLAPLPHRFSRPFPRLRQLPRSPLRRVGVDRARHRRRLRALRGLFARALLALGLDARRALE